MRVDSAALSDVGRVRQANEDAIWKGDSVFAVADGMGGHVAGEVASNTALEPIGALDGRVFPSAAAAVAALRDAVLEANEAVVNKASRDASYRGMGTTLTAAMVEGRRLHIAHVGDSRAYLLRHGEISRLTTDHTLVQRLLDRGEITEDEVSHHPQRSVVTRAIGISQDVDVDTLTVDLLDDDQVLLCSDGLTGLVPDDEIADRLLADASIDETAKTLIDRANEMGGADNISVVLLRWQQPTGTRAPVRVAKAASAGAINEGRDWAEKLGQLAKPSGVEGRRPAGVESDNERRRRFIAAGIGVVILLGVLIGGGRWLLSRSYYVGVEDGVVAIYQGVPASLGPFDLSWVSEHTEVHTDDLAPWWVRDLPDGIPAASLADARRIIDSAPRADDAAEPGRSG